MQSHSRSLFFKSSLWLAVVVILGLAGLAGTQAQAGQSARATRTTSATLAATESEDGPYPPCPVSNAIATMQATAHATRRATKTATRTPTQASTVLPMVVGPFMAGSGCTLTATLSGQNERPSTGAVNGSGTITLTLSRPAGGPGQVCFQIQVSDISLPAVQAHIHAGTADVAGSVIVPLAAPDASGSASGCTSPVERSVLQALMTTPEAYYVNVHTSDFPNGAIRGQLAAAAAPGATMAPTSATGLPAASFKQTPQEITFDGCPPAGDGGDPVLNENKNRVDEGNYQPTAFDTIANLTWPKETERTDHAKWSAQAKAEIDKAEGLPVAVEGYIALAREEGPETPNCHSATDHDFHIWFIGHPGGEADRAGAVVIEATPRVRAKHPGWTVNTINALARAGTRVRISGWLMLDPEHPDQVDKTRKTIWEIHPIMQIDVQQGAQWIALDNYKP